MSRRRSRDENNKEYKSVNKTSQGILILKITPCNAQWHRVQHITIQ